MSLRIRLFGVPTVEADGAAALRVPLRRHCVVLLAMIVLGDPDRRRSRRAVAAELWPDDDEQTAVANLRRHLSFLSAALPAADPFIGRDRDALWFAASHAPWCDVVAFERGELEQYRADFMEGYENEWVRAQRDRLRELAIARFVARAETLREDGDEIEAIACARRALEIDPLDESIAQLEIELHGERGDLAAVDAAFASLERRLREIDAAPTAASAQLVEHFHALAREAAARIPRPLTSFLETGALADVAQLVRAYRLVTIVGPGGVGKTRLALETAHHLATTFADGAYFADLSSVLDGDTLADVVSRDLGMPMGPAKSATAVHAFLRNRRALLILDNCEHIAAQCARFVNDALAAAPHLYVLATSREALGLGAERLYGLRPLPLADATQLLTERARTVGWQSDGVPATSKRFERICERLDRLPLALELAASMLGTLSLGDLERHLSTDFATIRSRDVTAPQRHRSLRDVIAWSVSLLTPVEREVFLRLSVFAGSFSAEAALIVCEADVATLAELVAKSVLVREDATEGRFVFLNSIGEYARRLFDASPSTAVFRDAHATFFADLAMQSEESEFWRSQRAWLRGIDRDFPSVVQALRWTLREGGAVRSGVRLAIGMTFYYLRRGLFAEGMGWIDAALEHSATGSVEFGLLLLQSARLGLPGKRFERTIDDARRARETFTKTESVANLARALVLEASGLIYLGRNVEADELFARGLLCAIRAGDRRVEAFALTGGAYVLSLSDRSSAREKYVVGLRLFEEIGDEVNVARTLQDIAHMDCGAGRYETAREYFERSLEVLRDVGDPFQITNALGDLGDVAVMRSDYVRARDNYEECLTLCEAYELEFAYDSILSSCSALAAQQHNYALAARLLGASHREVGVALGAAHERVRERARTTTESALGADAYALEMRLGRDLSRRDALRLARSLFTIPARRLTAITALTPRRANPKIAPHVRTSLR